MTDPLKDRITAHRSAPTVQEAADMPERLWRDPLTQDIWSILEDGYSTDNLVEYIRVDIARSEVVAARREALKQASLVAYVACAETRHVTLAQKVQGAILDLAEKDTDQ